MESQMLTAGQMYLLESVSLTPDPIIACSCERTNKRLKFISASSQSMCFIVYRPWFPAFYIKVKNYQNIPADSSINDIRMGHNTNIS